MIAATAAMRIFHILEFNQFNTGSVHQMFQAATGLRERGHAVTVVSRPDDTLEVRCREAGVDFVGLRLRNQFDLYSVRKLRGLYRECYSLVYHVLKGVTQDIDLSALWT